MIRLSMISGAILGSTVLIGSGPLGKHPPALPSASSAAAEVLVEPLQKQKISQHSDFYGHIEPRTIARLFTPVEGFVETLNVEPGQQVRRGTVLAKIRPASIDQDRNLLQLTAPMDGLVLESSVQISDLVPKNGQVLAVYRPGSFRSVLQVTPEDLSNLSPGKSLTYFLGEREGQATVAAISPKIDRILGTREVTVNVQSANDLQPGQLLRFRVTFGEKSGFLVPKNAVHEDGPSPYIFVLDKDLKVQKLEVTIGIKQAKTWEIIGPGLEENLQLITRATLEPLAVGQVVSIAQKSGK